MCRHCMVPMGRRTLNGAYPYWGSRSRRACPGTPPHSAVTRLNCCTYSVYVYDTCVGDVKRFEVGSSETWNNVCCDKFHVHSSAHLRRPAVRSVLRIPRSMICLTGIIEIHQVQLFGTPCRKDCVLQGNLHIKLLLRTIEMSKSFNTWK